MTIETSDIRSNPNEQIAHAAKVIGKSENRRRVFEEIHRGKKRIKTVDELVSKTGIDRKKVLEAAQFLYRNRIIKKTKVNSELAYERDDFFSQNKRLILRLARNKRALQDYPTKRNPRNTTIVVKLPIPRKAIDIKQIYVDDIDSFNKVTLMPLEQDIMKVPMYEKLFKRGLQGILSEQGEFEDWGGENDDLFSTRLLLNGKRLNIVFGLKGKGTKGKLTPKKMGKQGDQIQRLFRTPSDIFLIQYWGQIDESIIEQMKAFAIMKSVLEEKRIYYGVMDGQDTLRIVEAYKEYFEIDESSVDQQKD